MTLTLTALTVGYDTVVTVCRTWQKTAVPQPQHAHHSGNQQAA
ncbi:hypothetical protein ACIA8I_40455 [Streptomyces rishiriensis]